MNDNNIYKFYTMIRKKHGDDVLLYIYLTLSRYINFMEVSNDKRS